MYIETNVRENATQKLRGIRSWYNRCAGRENLLYATGRLKMREWKTWHQMTRVENAGVSDSDQ